MIAEWVGELDTGLFGYIASETTDGDRRSLLAIHNAIAATGPFSYLEIASHLGGTLQALIADERCVRIVSIDPRPEWQPDDRSDRNGCDYPGNSTARMIELLRGVPSADLTKLETVDESTEKLPPARFARPAFCVIDGEHTHRAALRDARFCRTVMHGAGIVVFHDLGVVAPAIVEFLHESPRPRRCYALESGVLVAELGSNPTILGDLGVRSQLRWTTRGWIAANRVGAGPAFLAAGVRLRARGLAARRALVG